MRVERDSSSTHADLAMRGGKIVTVDDEFSIASAIAIQGTKILAVGSDTDIQAYIGAQTEVIDLEGKTVLPGFVDPHGHIHSLGRVLQNLDLSKTTCFQDVVDFIAERVQSRAPGEWIIGQGWDQNTWPDKALPTHEALSAVSPENPVILNRIDGHAIISNACAMQLAGITDETPDPYGGKIHRARNGKATGLFVDLAEELIRQHEPVSDADIKARIKLASQALLKLGVTSFHDLGVSPQELEVYKEMDREGDLDLRIVGFFDDPEGKIDYRKLFAEQTIKQEPDRFFSINGIKLFRDGALGSRGALMKEPYSDDPENMGIEVATVEHIEEVTKIALDCGVQVITHAIGDLAIHTVLNAYEAALSGRGFKDHRLRLEHAQILSPEDLNRFHDLGVATSVQPGSAISDMGWTETRIGPERIKGAFRFRDIIDSGALFSISSDTPTESINPFETMFTATTRQNENLEPAGGWQPDQKITLEEALRAHTIWAAKCSFQDEFVGSIEPGKQADVVVVSHDILECATETLLEVKVEQTFIAGRCVGDFSA